MGIKITPVSTPPDVAHWVLRVFQAKGLSKISEGWSVIDEARIDGATLVTHTQPFREALKARNSAH